MSHPLGLSQRLHPLPAPDAGANGGVASLGLPAPAWLAEKGNTCRAYGGPGREKKEGLGGWRGKQ